MNIQLIKELEGYRVKKDNLSDTLHKMIRFEKEKLLMNAKQSFIYYFSNQQFQVSQISDKSVLAVFGETKVLLSLPKPEDAFFGAYSVLNLGITGSIKSNYTIAIRKINTIERPSAATSFTTDAETQKLENLKSETKYLQDRIDKFDQDQTRYNFYNTDAANNNPDIKVNIKISYSDIEKVFEEIFS